MSTGNVKTPDNRAKGLRFERDRLVVLFRDGREIHVPLRLYPTLERASQAERDHWIMLGSGKGFHWPKLDLDLSADGLIQGLRERVPAPPDRRSKRIA